MIKKVLLDCTVTMLKILLNQYERGLLTHNELIINTKIKTAFLEEHLSDIENLEEKNAAEIILKKLQFINHNSLATLNSP